MNSSINWDFVQEHANQILAEGIFHLRQRDASRAKLIAIDEPGNYLVSLDGIPRYIGEGVQVRKRLNTQFHPKRSTFYKTFIKANPEAPRNLEEFRVQAMATGFGRKEIEDFGIVNIPTELNKFQKNKRPKLPLAYTDEMWLLVQENQAKLLTEGAERYLEQSRVSWFEATPPDAPGLYGLWGTGESAPLYIGESSELAKRYKSHSGNTYISALRRHVGTELLGFNLKEKYGKKDRAFTDDEDKTVSEFLSRCEYSWLPVGLGRYEVESFLIKEQVPELNRKGNRRQLV
jgi:hypothetical protein